MYRGIHDYQIPYARGSPHTDCPSNYEEYPNNLREYLSNQSIPLQAFTFSNIARDLISIVLDEKERNNTGSHYAMSLSFGTYVLGRVLQFQPGLFSRSIFDGSIVSIL